MEPSNASFRGVDLRYSTVWSAKPRLTAATTAEDVGVGNSQVDLENLKAAFAFGQQALKSCELANGGAVLAILTFYGNVVKDGAKVPISLEWIRAALITFAIGLAITLIANLCAYLGQVFVATGKPDAWTPSESAERFTQNRVRASDRLIAAAVIMGALGVLLFAGGVVLAATAFHF